MAGINSGNDRDKADFRGGRGSSTCSRSNASGTHVRGMACRMAGTSGPNEQSLAHGQICWRKSLRRCGADADSRCMALSTQTVSGIELLPSITLHSLTPQRAKQAAQIAISCRLRGADAVYVALAQELGTSLITWDNEILMRTTAVVTAMTPTDWLAANPTI